MFIAFSVFPCLPAGAAPKGDETPVREIAIVVNGDELPREPAPRIVGGRLLVPIVRIYSALGITVSRSDAALIASAPSRRIVVHRGSRRATIDGRVVLMDTAAVEINNATYVPLRFVAESLGAQATFDASANRVEVVSSLVGRNPALEQRGASGARPPVTISAP